MIAFLVPGSAFPFKGLYLPYTNVVMATRVQVTFFQVKFQKREFYLVTERSDYSPCTLYVLGVGLGKVWTTERYTCSCVLYWHFPVNVVCVITAGSTCYGRKIKITVVNF